MDSSLEMIDYLKNSPVFASSLGSKELFHSNIWAYLINQNPRFLRAFFPDVNDSDIDEIVIDEETGENASREKYNMDLLVVTKNKTFVIENKIKSLPHVDQLEKYEGVIGEKYERIDKDNQLFLLTGIREDGPSILGTVKGKRWKYMGYRDIAKGIRKELKAYNQDELFYQFTEEYCKVIVDIADLMGSGVKAVTNQFFFPRYEKEYSYSHNDDQKTIKGIEKLRLGDIFQKLNAESFVKKVREVMECLGVQFEDPYTPIFKSGFTRKNSLAEFFFERQNKQTDNSDISSNNNKEPEEYVRIGVQIQNAQFRWYIEVKKSEKIAKIKEKVFSYGKEKNIGWFCAYDKKGLIEPPVGDIYKTTSMRGEKCEYEPAFVYQYYNIDPRIDPTACDFYKLALKVIEFLVVAKEKIDDLENVFLKKAD